MKKGSTEINSRRVSYGRKHGATPIALDDAGGAFLSGVEAAHAAGRVV